MTFHIDALPMLVDNSGAVVPVGSYVAGEKVFADDRLAEQYMVNIAKRDLEYRGFRDNRVSCFRLKNGAHYLLHRRIQALSPMALAK